MAGRKTVFVPSTFLHPDGAAVFAQDPDIEVIYALTDQERQEMRRSPEMRRTLQAKAQERLEAALPRIHALNAMGLTGHLPVTAEMMDRGKLLEVIFIAAAGTDRIDVAAATERGIVVVNAPNGNATAVAEHAIGLMLALCRRIADRDRAHTSGQKDGHDGGDAARRAIVDSGRQDARHRRLRLRRTLAG